MRVRTLGFSASFRPHDDPSTMHSGQMPVPANDPSAAVTAGGARGTSHLASEEDRAGLARDEEHVLRCLGAAVIMHWSELPTRIQRELFEHAVSMGEPRHTGELKQRIARFLAKHEDDGPSPGQG